jgi:hypothetical protein
MPRYGRGPADRRAGWRGRYPRSRPGLPSALHARGTGTGSPRQDGGCGRRARPRASRAACPNAGACRRGRQPGPGISARRPSSLPSVSMFRAVVMTCSARPAGFFWFLHRGYCPASPVLASLFWTGAAWSGAYRHDRRGLGIVRSSSMISKGICGVSDRFRRALLIFFLLGGALPGTGVAQQAEGPTLEALIADEARAREAASAAWDAAEAADEARDTAAATLEAAAGRGRGGARDRAGSHRHTLAGDRTPAGGGSAPRSGG